MQISLSLDRYHKNALENNAALISRLAKMPNTHVQIHIAGFNNHVNMFPALLERIKENGLAIDTVLFGNSENMRPYPCVGGQIILNYAQATLFDGGRAANLPGALHTEFPQFTFLTPNGEHLVAFDSFGRVTLGENSGRKISTKWRTSRGAKELMQVRADLVNATWNEELRARIFDGWRFHTK